MNNGLLGNPRPAFTSGLFPVVAGSVANVPHGLGGTPRTVRWVLVCNATAGEGGYAYGDEVAVASAGNNTANNALFPVFSYGANHSRVFLQLMAATFYLLRKDTGAQFTITTASWAAKCYAQ